MNKKQTAIYNSYKMAQYSELWQVYGNYSMAKELAMDSVKERMYLLNGSGLRIIGHNCNVFSIGFEYSHPETGELMFHYETNRTIADWKVS